METTIAREAASMPASNPLKAYLGQDEDGGEIIFAKSLSKAERLSDKPLRRASEYDKWAEAGKVPTQVLIEQFDWHFDCRYIGCNVSCNNTGEMWDGDDLLEESQPVYDEAGEVYCCPEHRQMQADWVAERKAIKEALPAKLAYQFPGTTLVESHVYGDPPMVEFNFPGGLGEVRWEVGSPTVWVARRDIPAWEAYKDSIALAEKPAAPSLTIQETPPTF